MRLISIKVLANLLVIRFSNGLNLDSIRYVRRESSGFRIIMKFIVSVAIALITKYLGYKSNYFDSYQRGIRWLAVTVYLYVIINSTESKLFHTAIIPQVAQS